MPTLSKPVLTIAKTGSDEMYVVRVKGEVHFIPEELQAMRQGRKYKLRCALWGADEGLNGNDDYLFRLRLPFRRSVITGGGHPPSIGYEFKAPVNAELLDDDGGIFQDETDDVYARITLRDLSIHQIVDAKKSNEWNQEF